MVYDQSEGMPGCAWTEGHTAQGFARRPSAVCFGTLLEFGHAQVSVVWGAYDPQVEYDRVIVVPFRCVSDKVVVEGPDEQGLDRAIDVPRGDYRLAAAQQVLSEQRERIDLYFERVSSPIECSAIIVADDKLSPPEPLIETARIACI